MTAGGERGVVGEWQGLDPPQARLRGRAEVQICVGRLKNCCGEALEDNYDYCRRVEPPPGLQEWFAKKAKAGRSRSGKY